MKPTDFDIELVNLINRHSIENESNTHDFVLAAFLLGCLKSFNLAVNERDRLKGIGCKVPMTALYDNLMGGGE